MSVVSIWITSLPAPSLFQAAGVAGFILYFLGFAGLQLGFVDGNKSGYSLCSILAAVLVLISLTEHFNLASAMIQISWILLGTTGLVCRRIRTRKTVLDRARSDR
ncbi:MAG: hypothetical protein AAGA12_11155 [Pseudomonadota bacterium]